MIDGELIAECIGLIKTCPTLTTQQVSNELHISQFKARQILNELEDCCLIVNFGDFYASTDLAELN